MITNATGQKLHDHATHGEPLGPEERAQLDAWYATQDQAESASLGSKPESSSLAGLRAKVDLAVAQLRVVSEHIQRLTTENEVVRAQIADLQLETLAKVRGFLPMTVPADVWQRPLAAAGSMRRSPATVIGRGGVILSLTGAGS